MGKKILIVDDDPPILRLADMMIKAFGYSTATAGDGEAAHKAFQNARDQGESFGLVLTDWKMPRLDGLGLYRAIRKDETVLPVLFMTGYGPTELQPVLSSDPHTSYIQKPFEMEKLEASLNRHLPIFS